MARCCTRCGARLTYATTPQDSRRSIGTGTSSWSYIELMTPSEEMIPRPLRFKIASHVRTADRANQLFKIGSWNRVAGNCRESGRFKKRLKKLHPTCGYHNQNGGLQRPAAACGGLHKQKGCWGRVLLPQYSMLCYQTCSVVRL